MDFLKKRYDYIVSHWPFWAAFSVSLCLAFVIRFVQDDGLIYFRYALNFAEGRGLVWNPGERVDGYLNLLWILLLGAGHKAGFDLIAFSYLCGLLFFSITFVYTYRAITLFSGHAVFNFLVLLCLGTNFSFISCATGGIETHMHLCLLMASAYYFLRVALHDDCSTVNLLRLSCLLGLAFVTRMDSSVLILCVVPSAFCCIFFTKQHVSKFRLIAALTIPSSFIAAGYLVFRVFYFGDIFPNVYYAKAGVDTVLIRGFNYIFCFYHNYMLETVLAVTAAGFLVLLLHRRSRYPRRFVGSFVTIGLIFVLWNCYVLKVNGDYMEFRLMVPALPFLALLFCCACSVLFKYKLFLYVLLILLCMNNLKIFYINHMIDDIHHHRRFMTLHYPIPVGVESVRSLNDNLWDESRAWVDIGKTLGRVFNFSQEIKIAVMPAGAIPFYSRLPTLDMLGLNDRWVARHGFLLSSVPGHSRMATPEYLLESNVNLVIALPYLVNHADAEQAARQLSLDYFYMRDDVLPDQSRLLCIPVNPAKSIIVLYLQRHQVIDDAIALNRFRIFDINLSAPSTISGRNFWFQ